MATKRIRGYCRVSTDLQLDGVSLEVQEMRITDYCTQHGHNLIKIYKDALSGKDINRPQLQLMLSELLSEEIVAVVDLSRLSRTTLDALQLIDQFTKMHVGFISITQPFDTTTPVGEAMMTVQLGFNQMERKNTALKVKGAMQALRQQGKLRGKPPFGWKFVGKDRDFEPEPDQQRITDKIRELYAQGTTINRIAAILNQNGDNRFLANNKKNPEKFKDALFHHATVKRILVENSIIDGGTMQRKPVELQIVSHRKKSLETQFPFTPLEVPVPVTLPDPFNLYQPFSLPPPPQSHILPPPPQPYISSLSPTLPPFPISRNLPPPPVY